MVFGTETEYGIVGPPGVDPAVASGGVIRGLRAAWCPGTEDENAVLGNGARAYVDHAHPEYCTPEVTTPSDLVAHAAAGDVLMARAAAAAAEEVGGDVRLFKNNTDGRGASYGSHENYLVPRSVPFEAIVAGLTAHLVTRLPLCGAGRVGLGRASSEPGFQISQRADFFEALVGLETTRRRPIVNTRDEPHADPRRWRRLHVIVGDATLAQVATFVRFGATALVLTAIEAQLPLPVLADPLGDLVRVSRDLTCRVPLQLADGRTASALEVQAEYLAAARVLAERAPDVLGVDTAAVLREWGSLLDDLRDDPALVADRVDWAAKLALLNGFRRRDGLAWDADRLVQIDLRYAEIDPGRSLYSTLLARGRMRRLVDHERIAAALVHPPDDTRAYLRGHLVATYPRLVVAAGWDSMLMRDRDGALVNLRMSDPLEHTAADVPWSP